MPTKPKATMSEIDRKAFSAKSRVVKPKSSVRGTVLTGPEARAMQDKQSKKKYKNPKNTTSSSRYS